MSIYRRIGIMIMMAVPAIIGGGIVFHFSPNWTSVIIYEILLLMAFLGFIAK